MILQVAKGRYDENEWDCENWGEDGDWLYVPESCFRKRVDRRSEEDEKAKEKATQTKEKGKGKEKEEETDINSYYDSTESDREYNSDDSNNSEFAILEKSTVFGPRTCHSSTVMYAFDAARLALDEYNKYQGTKYHFSYLVEAIYHSVICNGIQIDKYWSLYCIKFKGSLKLVTANENDREIFHTKVLFGKSKTLVLDIQKHSRNDIEFDIEAKNLLVEVPTEKASPSIMFYSMLALDDFNKNKDAKYSSFVSLVKASAYLVCSTDWCIYDIWFKAYQNDKAASLDTFRAKVFDHKGVASVVMDVGIFPAGETSTPDLEVAKLVQYPINPSISQWMLPPQ